MTVRAWILSHRAENESLGGGLSRTFFAVMRLGEDLGLPSPLDTVQRLWKELRRSVGLAEDMLRFLARCCKRSLLGDYACLRPAP